MLAVTCNETQNCKRQSVEDQNLYPERQELKRRKKKEKKKKKPAAKIIAKYNNIKIRRQYHYQFI